MNSIILASVVNFLHLLATVAWFGAMTANTIILLPSMRKILDSTVAGNLMGAVLKRFGIVVYASIGILVVTGIEMTLINENSIGFMQFNNIWSTVSSIKHILMVLLIILVIYSFEGLSKNVVKLSADGSSPKLVSLQKRQRILSYIGLTLVIIILFLTGIMTAI